MKLRRMLTTEEQLKRRARRPPESCHDPRFKNHPYWAAIQQGYPPAHARRAFRNQPPEIIDHVVTVSTEEIVAEYGCDPEEIFFPTGSTWQEIRIEFLQLLTEEVIPGLQPRRLEYTVWDHQVPGLGVRVRASGHKTFICCYRLLCEKKLRKTKIGDVREFSLVEARQVAKGFRREARMGIDPAKRLRRQAKPN